MILVFDIDGVLTNIGECINKEFSLFLLKFLNARKYYLITGSDITKSIYQIGNELINNATISYHCLGNQYKKNETINQRNQFTLVEEELDFITDLYKSSFWTKKSETFLHLRQGSINFSLVGQSASDLDKIIYAEQDMIIHERLKFVNLINQNLSRLSAFVGGRASIDLCLKGCDKSQIFREIGHSPITFFGDRCSPGGVDYPLAKLCIGEHKVYEIKNGYLETWDLLKKIF